MSASAHIRMHGMYGPLLQGGYARVRAQTAWLTCHDAATRSRLAKIAPARRKHLKRMERRQTMTLNEHYFMATREALNARLRNKCGRRAAG